MPPVVQCFKCGTQNQLGMRFCISCGEKFAYNCPQCNNLIEPGTNNCSQCGVKLDWGYQTSQPNDFTIDKNPPGQAMQKVSNLDRIKTEKSSRKGINPWLIAFIVVIILIIAIVALDSVI
jgi:uncharacterized membrane protein YvbJ